MDNCTFGTTNPGQVLWSGIQAKVWIVLSLTFLNLLTVFTQSRAIWGVLDYTFPCAIILSFCNTSFRSLVSTQSCIARPETSPWTVINSCSLGGKATDPILKRETAESLFIGALNEDGEKSLNAMFAHIFPGLSAQWTNAFSVSTNDWPNRRRKGSGCCTFSCLRFPWTWTGINVIFDRYSGM